MALEAESSTRLIPLKPTEKVTLAITIRPWPIASRLASYLPAGDLISLARTDSSLRAALHNFPSPPNEPHVSGAVRDSLYIGCHETLYWRRLKATAPFLCSSPTHTKGVDKHPCRYCSKPICEACVVKSSFGKGEKTYANRVRYLCKTCWTSGNIHRSKRFAARPADVERLAVRDLERYNFAPGKGEFCSCSNKDGWVCSPCKEMQNTEAKSSGERLCFGQGCNEQLVDDKIRRRICLWCDMPMLPGRPSMESRVAFDQKMMCLFIKNEHQRQAEIRDPPQKRQKLFDPSRQSVGDETVNDPDAISREEADTPSTPTGCTPSSSMTLRTLLMSYSEDDEELDELPCEVCPSELAGRAIAPAHQENGDHEFTGAFPAKLDATEAQAHHMNERLSNTDTFKSDENQEALVEDIQETCQAVNAEKMEEEIGDDDWEEDMVILPHLTHRHLAPSEQDDGWCVVESGCARPSFGTESHSAQRRLTATGRVVPQPHTSPVHEPEERPPAYGQWDY